MEDLIFIVRKKALKNGSAIKILKVLTFGTGLEVICTPSIKLLVKRFKTEFTFITNRYCPLISVTTFIKVKINKC